MKILSIDQSYTSSGIAVFEDGNFLRAEIFKSDPEKDIFSRVWDITQHIVGIAIKEKPDMIALEGLAFAKFGNATRDLAGLQFTLIVHLKYVHQFNIKVIPPNTVKKIATGKGNSKKEEMYECLPAGIKQVFLDMGAKKTKGLYDLSDAYWIGRSAIELK